MLDETEGGIGGQVIKWMSGIEEIIGINLEELCAITKG